MKRFLIFVFLVFTFFQYSSGTDTNFTQEDRERLIRLETIMKEFKDSVDKRFVEFREYGDKRFEQIDKRFVEFRDYVDKRFEQIDKKFEQMISFLWILTAIFVGIVGVTIGFAIWDRRTMIRPFESKVREIEEEILSNKEKLHQFLSALKALAKTDEKLAEILKELKIL